MACEVCEHCNAALSREEAVFREGYSYHARCHKCYVCSETNLQNANVFKGVIFCSGCSNRIFQGCSTARRRVKSVKTRRSQRPEYKEYKERQQRYDKGYNKYANQVLRLAWLTAAESRSFSGQSKEFKTSTSPSTVATALTNFTYQMKKPCQLQKNSLEMGTTTTVTKELLKHIISPIDIESKVATPVKPKKKRKSNREKTCKKNYCSDPRIAELGASTEIAHMALRRPSEVPVIIKSETALKRTATRSLSNLTPETDVSGEGDLKRLSYSECTSDLVNSYHWLNHTIGSIIKLPYRRFKKNILDRSSLVSVIMSSRGPDCALRGFRTLFRHEITDHQRRGLKRLFSTINRRKEQYKLGWLDIMNKIPEDERLNTTEKREKRCRHFKQSHSYRCMRTQVMRLAGPSRSELAVLRKKLKNALCLNLCKDLRSFNNNYVDLLTSVACERSRKEPAPIRITSYSSFNIKD